MGARPSLSYLFLRDWYWVPGPIKDFPSIQPFGAIMLGQRCRIVAGTWMQLYPHLPRGSRWKTRIYAKSFGLVSSSPTKPRGGLLEPPKAPL